jgi:replication factor C small subunit
MPYVDRYRPVEFSGVFGQEHVVNPLKEIVEKWKCNHDKPPNMLFLGPAGVGKTTLAVCFAKALYGENYRNHFHEYNASDDRKIEVIRTKIKPQSQSVIDQIIFFDEADGLTLDSQQALRRIIERSQHTTFILSANIESKLIEPIRSRCVPFRFKRLSDVQVLDKLAKICEAEGVKVTFNDEERDAFKQILEESHGDMRKAINVLEKIITAKKELNVKSVLEMKSVPLVSQALNTALEGKLVDAKNFIEDAYAMGGSNIDGIVDDFYFAVSELKSEDIQACLYHELGELEHRLKTTNRPLIQLTSFVAYSWVVTHVGR